ncbi:MAG: polysaccharide biosynthesis protein, partial [Pseudomonadota bacterium]
MTPQTEARRAMLLTLSFDVATAFVSMFIAISAPWFWTTERSASHIVVMSSAMSVIFACIAFVSFYSLSVHRQVWRHSGWPDAVRVIQAVALSILIFLPVIFLINRAVGFPRSSIPLSIVIWLLLLFVGRMVALSRSTRRPLQIFQAVRRDAPIALLVATTNDAADVLRNLRNTERGAPVRILGLLEVDGVDPGRAIRGVPILGSLDDLGKVLDLLNLRYGNMPWIAVAGKTRHQDCMATILELGAKRGARVMALGVKEEGLHLQGVQPATLLERPERNLDIGPVKALLKDKRVFITGAGGSIGSELVRQCSENGVKHLTLYDASEYNLYSIDLDVRERFPDLNCTTVLGDVRDTKRLHQSMVDAMPEIVIHAAALKHVPLMEMNACEAILTNVGGTVNAADAALNVGATRFVFVSTDKAVDPDNVMGATKRLAELALAYRAIGSKMAVSMVRFGNVLGSSGSVIPLF